MRAFNRRTGARVNWRAGGRAGQRPSAPYTFAAMGEPDRAADSLLRRVAASPDYRRLVRERSRFAWALTGVMLAIYFGFILLVAFGRELLARPVGGGTTTLGILIGIGVILSGILLTAIYVQRANRRFDALTRAILDEAGL